MATFRCSVGVAVALVCIACSPQSAQEVAPAAAPVERIQRDTIEHVRPTPDSSGPLPKGFEWTPAKGVEEYALTVENEVDMLIFEARTPQTSLAWPEGHSLDPGTYFWRVVGTTAGRRVADSGRSAFVVTREAR
jgi:hypothetical protein